MLGQRSSSGGGEAGAVNAMVCVFWQQEGVDVLAVSVGSCFTERDDWYARYKCGLNVVSG